MKKVMVVSGLLLVFAGMLFADSRSTAYLKNESCAKRYDVAYSSITYVGYAAPGITGGESRWCLYRITIDGNVTSIEFADGDVSYDNVWDNRATLTYK